MQVRATISTISTIVVDDEQLARDELSFLLKDFPDIEVIATASNGIEAATLIENTEPDLVFLDVEMPGLDGIGVIRNLREKKIPLPYFVMATAYENYAVEAFRLEATDYILKPVEKARLAGTIERARRIVAERTRLAEAAHLAPNSPRSAAPANAKILVRKEGRHYIVDSQEIVYATIDDGVISVVAAGIEGETNYDTMEELQSALDPDQFWRVHRSWLVNINKIREVIPWFKSTFQLKMDDKKQTEVPVSRVQTKRLRTLLKL